MSYFTPNSAKSDEQHHGLAKWIRSLLPKFMPCLSFLSSDESRWLIDNDPIGGMNLSPVSRHRACLLRRMMVMALRMT